MTSYFVSGGPARAPSRRCAPPNRPPPPAGRRCRRTASCSRSRWRTASASCAASTVSRVDVASRASAPLFTQVDLSPRGNYLAIGPAGNATGGARPSSGCPAAQPSPASRPTHRGGWTSCSRPARRRCIRSASVLPTTVSTPSRSPRRAGRRADRPRVHDAAWFLRRLPGPVRRVARRVAVVRRLRRSADRRRPARQGLFGRDNAVLSSDGMFLAVAGPSRGSGVTLWRLRPDPAPLLTIGERADEANWQPLEFPVAITRRRGANADRRPVHRELLRRPGVRGPRPRRGAGMVLDTSPAGSPRRRRRGPHARLRPAALVRALSRR